MAITDKIKLLLNKFTFVVWDRYTFNKGEYTFYGWIEREDNYKDFLILNFYAQTVDSPYMVTSSAKYSEEIVKIIGFPGMDHIKCKRIEGIKGIKNVVKL